jgi:hypothetical protein
MRRGSSLEPALGSPQRGALVARHQAHRPGSRGHAGRTRRLPCQTKPRRCEAVLGSPGDPGRRQAQGVRRHRCARTPRWATAHRRRRCSCQPSHGRLRNPASSAGHANRGATSNPELTSNPGNPVGADQAAGARDRVLTGGSAARPVAEKRAYVRDGRPVVSQSLKDAE